MTEAQLQAQIDDLKSRLNPAISLSETTPGEPLWHKSLQAANNYINLYQKSTDDGESWTQLPASTLALPKGWHKDRVTTIYVPGTKKLVTFLNCYDIDLGTVFEPAGAMAYYYLAYRTSSDFGQTWTAPVKIPVPGVTEGLNAALMGDIGCVPIHVGNDNSILVPANISVLEEDGETLYSPGGNGFWFYDVVLLHGHWNADGTLGWSFARIPGDVAKSVRGFIEPTLATLKNNRILCVMRGSNGGATDPSYTLPSRKWASFSSDEGMTWTTPIEWSYASGALVSPSAMSRLFNHSSGRVFWVGHDSDQANVNGSLPRYPVILLEVDSRTGLPIASSRTVLGTPSLDDLTHGRVDMYTFWIVEGPQGQLIITFAITYPADGGSKWQKVELTV